MLLRHVTLCLLITYHWRGCSARSTGVWSAAATPGIAAEVNGSPTDARLNIPVVKRSSNQATFANELRGIVGERARVVESVVPTLFELPHEYANRDGEKYTTEKLVESQPVVCKRVADGAKEEEAKEKEGKVVRGIKSSIQAGVAVPLEVRLIGKANSPPATLRLRRRFDYERASTASGVMRKGNDEKETTDCGDATVPKKEKKKAIWRNEKENNRGAAIISSVFASDASDSTIHRTRREVEATTLEEEEFGGKSATIDGQLEKQRKQQQEDYDASRTSHRLSPLYSLKPTDQPLPEKSRLIATAEFNKILDSRRLHQQSRNTRPQDITQHLRRNIKRQTSFDDNNSMRSTNFRVNREMGSDFVPLGYNRNQREANHRQIPNSPSSPQGLGPELRFIPANRYRPDNTVYFQRILKPLPPPPGAFQDNGNDASRFVPNGEVNPQEIDRFNAAQIENLKNSIRGVFDKYESRQQGQSHLLPNVRMIHSKQIFVAPPRLIYDTKILPAPFSFNPYFQHQSNNVNNADTQNDNQQRIMEPEFTIKGVFDQSHKESELDQGEVISVKENSPPSLTNTRNFVTPLPPYRVGGDGEVSVRVNQATEDPNVLNEIYRVSGERGIPELENESQRAEEDEASRLNHESPIEVGEEHHLGEEPGVGSAGGSSYDNSVGTSANRDESRSTNVDHSAVIKGTTDEYGNHSPADRTRTQSVSESNRNTYDRGNYKWRGDNDHEHYAANYSFGYRVLDYQSDNEFGHQETRNEGITKGKYHVRLPDGRIQKVNYHVDDGGYHASVSYHNDNAE